MTPFWTQVQIRIYLSASYNRRIFFTFSTKALYTLQIVHSPFMSFSIGLNVY